MRPEQRSFATNRAIAGNSPCGLTGLMTLTELQEHERRFAGLHDDSCPFTDKVVRMAPKYWERGWPRQYSASEWQ